MRRNLGMSRKTVPTEGKTRGRKNRSGAVSMPLIIGGSVAAILLLGVGAYFLFRGGETPNDQTLALKWLPQDTEVIVHLKVSEALQAPVLKGLLGEPSVQARIQELQAVGLTLADIESVTIGIRESQRLQDQVM